MNTKNKQNLPFTATRITGGFWKQKQDMIRSTTIYSVYRRFAESGRVEAFACKPEHAEDVHYYWDSDVAKWIESVAYLAAEERNETLEAWADAIIADIAANQWEDGYINSYYTVRDPAGRFQRRKRHELYCAGHLIEAAIAYKHATGKDLLYRCMLRYADLIDRIFRVEKSAGFLTPGHQELELALVKLYRESGERRYLDLAVYFLDARGSIAERAMANLTEEAGETMFELPYAQDQAPVRQMQTAEGHAVRLLYMCIAMADVAAECNDAELQATCERLFADIVNKKMYITGGVGSNANHEGFDEAYHLPNAFAYNETCASIAMCFFAAKMQLLSSSSAYADVIERELYNGVLSGISLCGKKFFYENPLEIDLSAARRLPGEKMKLYFPLTERVELFWCSCCPPNLTRIIPSVADFLYTLDGDVLRVNQYMESETICEGDTLAQLTDYPRTGKIAFSYRGKTRRVGFRIPFWCQNFSVQKNGIAVMGELCDGYYYLPVSDGETVTLDLDMTPAFYEANPAVRENAWKVAVMRGPVVYCAEGIDNPDVDLWEFRTGATVKEADGDEFYVPKLCVYGEERRGGEALYGISKYMRRQARLTLIPYYAFANRGKSDMAVWLKQ